MKKTAFSLLILIAMFMSGCSVPPPASTPSATDNPDAQLACTDREKEVKTLLDNINSCQVDADCTVLPEAGVCPFGCYNFANKDIAPAELARLSSLLESHGKDCPSCAYKCVAPPSANEIGCRQNKCVDLRYNSNTTTTTLTRG